MRNLSVFGKIPLCDLQDFILLLLPNAPKRDFSMLRF